MRKIAALIIVWGALVAILVTGIAGTGSASAQGGTETRVLVWESTPEDDGVLEVISSGGTEEVLVDFEAGAFGNWAKRCGQDFWSANGQGAAIFTGADEGDIAIYPLAGDVPVSLGTANRMACAGPLTFQFSPDRNRVGYIDYAVDVLDQVYEEYPYGDLVFFDAASGAQLAAFDWANSFMLYDDGALMLRIFPDGEGYGTEADLEWWDGSARRTLTTVEPLYPPDVEDVDCGIKNSAVARLGDTAYLLTGQRCEQNNTTDWRLVSVPMDGGSVTEIALSQPGGGFFSESFTVNLFPTEDNSGFLMTMPSGLTRNSVQLMWITPDGNIAPVLEGRHVLAERYGERLSEGRLLMVSPDGKSLSFVTVTANGDQTLWMLDLSTVGGEPVVVEEEGSGQRIFQHVWSANNNLYYIAGSIESNSLHMVSSGGSSQRLERGRFFRLAVSYDGNKIATAEWYANPNSVGDDLFKLNVFDTSGNAFVLKEGGEEHNQMIPLAIK